MMGYECTHTLTCPNDTSVASPQESYTKKICTSPETKKLYSLAG